MMSLIDDYDIKIIRTWFLGVGLQVPIVISVKCYIYSDKILANITVYILVLSTFSQFLSYVQRERIGSY